MALVTPAPPEPPDPRFTLANERTFLAWVRTTLALIAGALALHSFEVPDDRTWRSVLVLGLVLLSAVLMVIAYVRMRRVDAAIRAGREVPPLPAALAVALVAVIVGAALAVVLV